MTLDNVTGRCYRRTKNREILPVDVIDGVTLPDDGINDRCFTLFTSSHENLMQGSTAIIRF